MKTVKYILFVILCLTFGLNFLNAQEQWSEALDSNKQELTVQRAVQIINKRWWEFKEKTLTQLRNIENKIQPDKKPIFDRLMYLIGGNTTIQNKHRNIPKNNSIGLISATTNSIKTNTTSESSGAKTRYPGCTTDDTIFSNGQVWATCNVGATSVFTGYLSDEKDNPLASDDNAGKVFNWNYGGMASNYNTSRIPSNTCIWDRDDQKCKSWIPDWQDKLRTGNLEHWFEWGDSKSPNTRGPCAKDYHVPTVEEWKSVFEIFKTRNKLVSALKLPTLGFRYQSDSPFIAQGDNINYWASSPNLEGFYTMAASNSTLLVFENTSVTNEFPVRCIKN